MLGITVLGVFLMLARKRQTLPGQTSPVLLSHSAVVAYY